MFSYKALNLYFLPVPFRKMNKLCKNKVHYYTNYKEKRRFENNLTMRYTKGSN